MSELGIDFNSILYETQDFTLGHTYFKNMLFWTQVCLMMQKAI